MWFNIEGVNLCLWIFLIYVAVLCVMLKIEKPLERLICIIFSLNTIKIIKDAPVQLPNEFSDLSYVVDEYRIYEVDKDDDLDRLCSYLRLYEMICLIQTYYKESDMIQVVLNDLNKFRKCSDIINAIYKNPGITYEKIKSMVHVDESLLMGQLNELEIGKYVLKYRPHDNSYYVLTNLGDILYENLK